MHTMYGTFTGAWAGIILSKENWLSSPRYHHLSISPWLAGYVHEPHCFRAGMLTGWMLFRIYGSNDSCCESAWVPVQSCSGDCFALVLPTSWLYNISTSSAVPVCTYHWEYHQSVQCLCNYLFFHIMFCIHMSIATSFSLITILCTRASKSWANGIQGSALLIIVFLALTARVEIKLQRT